MYVCMYVCIVLPLWFFKTVPNRKTAFGGTIDSSEVCVDCVKQEEILDKSLKTRADRNIFKTHRCGILFSASLRISAYICEELIVFQFGFISDKSKVYTS